MIGDTLKVRKLGPEGTPKIEYSGAIREQDERSISIDTGWSREELELGYVTFKPDDKWVETFYLDRWYNIFRIAGADGRLKGFYCNLCRPPILGNGVLTWQDMAIDVWVRPDSSFIILDEDEFELLGLPQEERDPCFLALDELLQMLKKREGPFGELRHFRRPRSRTSLDARSTP